jgi:hypothetical protein
VATATEGSNDTSEFSAGVRTVGAQLAAVPALGGWGLGLLAAALLLVALAALRRAL